MNTRWIPTAAASAAIGLVALTGCGSDDSSTTSTTSTASTSTVSAAAKAAPGGTPAGKPIVVGNIGSYSGPVGAVTGGGDDVIAAWEKATNAAGGLNGHPVKVITVDDASSPAKALAGAKKLVEQDGVVAVIGQLSAQAGAFQKYLDQKKIPVVGGQSIDTPYLTDPNFFPSGATLVPLFVGALQLSKDVGSPTLGVAYCAETPLCSQAVPVLQGLSKVTGTKLSTQKVSSTAASYTAPCLALKGDDAKAVITIATSNVGRRIVGACKKQGFAPTPIGTTSTVDPTWLTDPTVDGTVVAGSQALYTDTAVPGIKRLRDAVDRYSPGLSSSPQFSNLLVFTWSGGELFAAAAKAAKLGPESTPEDVRRGLYALKGETLGGIAPPLTFVKGKPGFTPCYFTSKVAAGKFEATNGDKPTCLDEKQTAAVAAALG